MSHATAGQTMTLGERSESGHTTFGVINPATGAVFAEAPECGPAQLDTAMRVAAEVFAA
jgi:acyl-CoA reductase-like NAD-dependent aldehyde dehydrogenase